MTPTSVESYAARSLGAFDTLGLAFHALLPLVLSFGSPEANGRAKAIEIGPTLFQIRDPLCRVITTSSRRVNLPFLVAEAVWQVSGRRDAAFLEPFAPSIARYGAEDGQFTGTAYGAQIFPDQWENLVSNFQQDPKTRRAVLHISPIGDGSLADPDFPCTTSFHFRIAGGRLHLTTHMRANDVMRGLQSDVFFATLLQELLGHELGVGLGTYTHAVNYFQIYDRDLAWAAACSEDRPRCEGRFALPPTRRSRAALQALSVQSDETTTFPGDAWAQVLNNRYRTS